MEAVPVAAEAVETVNVVEVAPDGMLTVAGTVTCALALVTETTAPPEGAALERVKVPTEEVPGATVAGLSPSEEREGAGVDDGFTVMLTVRLAPPYDAEMVGVAELETPEVEMAKLASAFP